MKMRKEANDFLKICDILDRDYQKTDGNKFRYTKTYLEQNVGSDYDQLKSLHAEATDGKASDTYAMLTNLFAVIISTVTLVITIGNALAPRTLLKRRDDGLDALVSIYSYIGQVKGDRRNT